jgi:hypothetical protein
MSNKRDRVLKMTAAALVPALWAASLGSACAQAPAAPAPRTFNSTVTHTGPAGNTLTRQSSLTTNGQGGITSNSTWTGAKGNTASAQQSGQYNAATKTYTGGGTFTGPNGKQSTFNTTIQGNGNGGYTRTTTLTGPNGKTITTTGQGQYNAATGTFTRAVTVAPAAQPPSN